MKETRSGILIGVLSHAVARIFSLRSSEAVGTEIFAAAVKGALGHVQKEAWHHVANLTDDAFMPG